jgi:hypothetical protein
MRHPGLDVSLSSSFKSTCKPKIASPASITAGPRMAVAHIKGNSRKFSLLTVTSLAHGTSAQVSEELN